MKTTSKVLLAVAAASGAAAYLINKFGSSKKDEPNFDNTLELYQSDIENMNVEEFGEFLHELNSREIPPNLTAEEKTEYLDAVSVLSDSVKRNLTRFVESGEMSCEEADVLHRTFDALGSFAEFRME